MWREDPLRGRVNGAAVVKAVAITGESSMVSVTQQVEQAFAAPFQDTATGALQLVHECFVITPREMKKEGAHTLHNVLQAKSFGRNVTIIDGEQLWQHVQAHLGPRVTLGTIIANYHHLNSQSGYDLQLNLAKAKPRSLRDPQRVNRFSYNDRFLPLQPVASKRGSASNSFSAPASQRLSIGKMSSRDSMMMVRLLRFVENPAKAPSHCNLPFQRCAGISVSRYRMMRAPRFPASLWAAMRAQNSSL
ncbi:MAG TPA: hypothetical protein VJZ76_17850 [Thermoanaerobaculia bacterium]|nr:hypothetical protein [Thermoanaerobaculia bacterium]